MIPILGSRVSPQCSATSINADGGTPCEAIVLALGQLGVGRGVSIVAVSIRGGRNWARGKAFAFPDR